MMWLLRHPFFFSLYHSISVQAVGTHDELLAANTIYQEIYNQQNRKGGEE